MQSEPDAFEFEFHDPVCVRRESKLTVTRVSVKQGLIHLFSELSTVTKLLPSNETMNGPNELVTTGPLKD